MKDGRSILAGGRFDLTISRLAHEVVENYPNWDNACIIGIQESGVVLSDVLCSQIAKITKRKRILTGKLDITFYRDDFRMREVPLAASDTELDFSLDGMRVILVDDVLYTGRTVQAALAALQDYGRPAQVELLSLVDRRFVRHLPIEADYVGITVDAINDSYVKVSWDQEAGDHSVILYHNQSQQS
jgi:pyrimidine operon attenuation protein/uracil phosphoribosyltransferase